MQSLPCGILWTVAVRHKSGKKSRSEGGDPVTGGKVCMPETGGGGGGGQGNAEAKFLWTPNVQDRI